MSELFGLKNSNNTTTADKYIEVTIKVPVFAYRIRQHRLASGMTQKQLADAVGISRVQITNIETKSTQTTIQTILKMCDVFCVTPNDLLL
jgi:DNA-binding XRE family transcriptional regulator